MMIVCRRSSLKAFLAGLFLLAVGGLWDAGMVSAAAEPGWTQQAPSPKPPGGSANAMAYDAGRHTVLVFAGSDASTWIWDGSSWSKKTPSAKPSAREGASAAYDAVSGRVILFGGASGSTVFNDTWAWDGANWSRLCDGCAPAPRFRAAMVSDAARNRLLLFGGFSTYSTCASSTGSALCPSALGDAWTWDGAAWVAAPNGPDARALASMAYDAQRQEVVLFGGCTGTAVLPNFTHNCREMDGGKQTGLKFLGDTWTWNGSSWAKKLPEHTPGLRASAGSGFEGWSKRVAIFGGVTGPSSISSLQLWMWDGVDWVEKVSTDGPTTTRLLTNVATDEARNQLLVFGGIRGGSPIEPVNETWIYGGVGVVQVSPNSVVRGTASVELAIKGNSFADGASVSFSGSGVTASGSAQFLSATSLKVNIDVEASAAIGPRDVIVTTPSGRVGTCIGCLVVTGTNVTPPGIVSVDGRIASPAVGKNASPTVEVSGGQDGDTLKLFHSFNGNHSELASKAAPPSGSNVKFNEAPSADFSLGEGVHELSAGRVTSDGSTSPESSPFTYIVDSTPPLAPTVSIQERINLGQASSVRINGETELGATVNVAVNDEDPATGPVSGAATVTGSAYSVRMNLTSLRDGPLTAEAVTTDSSGNAGSPGRATALKDTQAPAAPRIKSVDGIGVSPASTRALTPPILVEGLDAGDSVTTSAQPGGSHTKVVPPGAGSLLFTEISVNGGRTPIESRSIDPSGNVSAISERFEVWIIPTVTRLTPVVAHPSGGAKVQITGFGLSNATKVLFGAKSATFVTENDGLISATAPSHDPGPVDVWVETTGGVSDALGFTYGMSTWKRLAELETMPGGDCTAPAGNSPGDAQSRIERPCRARYLHSGTVLDNGEVLVAGGTTEAYDGNRSAQTYNPAANRWTMTGFMATPRFDHTATKLDGPACRSSAKPSYCGGVLIVGGSRGGPALSSVEFYDPETRAWTAKAALNAGRFKHQAVLLDGPDCYQAGVPSYCGKVLVAGGASAREKLPSLSSVELYDPQTNSWTMVSPLGTPRSAHAMTQLPDGRVLVAGGLTPGKSVDIVTTGASEVLDLSGIGGGGGGLWIPTGGLHEPRFDHRLTVLDGPLCEHSPRPSHCGKVLATGGMSTLRPFTYLASTELFDPEATDESTEAVGAWSPYASMNFKRGAHSATLLRSGKVLVAGSGTTWGRDFGTSGNYLTEAEILDLTDSTWTTTAPMNDLRAGYVALGPAGNACKADFPPSYCEGVVAMGGSWANPPSQLPLAKANAEMFLPGLQVAGLVPATGPAGGGAQVKILGSGFTTETAVTFGGVPVSELEHVSSTEMIATAPAQPAGAVDVAVSTGPKATADLGFSALPYVYGGSAGVPGSIENLAGEVLSETEVDLTFSAPYIDSQFPGYPEAATDYVVKESLKTIDDEESFDKADSVCPEGVCRFRPDSVGAPLKLRLQGLSPGTAYHYSIRAVNEKGPGPISNSVALTTLGEAPANEEPRTGTAVVVQGPVVQTTPAVLARATPRTQPVPPLPNPASVIAGLPAGPLQVLIPKSAAPVATPSSTAAPAPTSEGPVEIDRAQGPDDVDSLLGSQVQGWMVFVWIGLGLGYLLAGAVWWVRFRRT